MNDTHNLSWYNFSKHLHLLFEELYKNESYADVTLVSADKIEFKAHKIVLSACSPILKKIIDNNPSQHPLIYQTEIESQEIESILHFMYIGEGKSYQERIGKFIKVAKDLEIKQFSDGFVKERENDDFIKGRIPETKDEKTVGNQQYFRCDYHCDYQTKTYGYLQKHKKSKHEVFNKYACNQCDYKAKQQSHLKIHIQSKHEGFRYPCTQCDYKIATTPGGLQKHIKSIHEGIKYPCNQCDYQGTQQVHLKKHIESKHEGIRYPCDQCDYQAITKSHIQRHVKSQHA